MIALGADHGGFLLKEAIKAYLEQENIAYHDFGTYSEDSVDYAPIAEQVAHAVANGEAEKGILCCGTGIGISVQKQHASITMQISFAWAAVSLQKKMLSSLQRYF